MGAGPAARGGGRGQVGPGPGEHQGPDPRACRRQQRADDDGVTAGQPPLPAAMAQAGLGRRSRRHRSQALSDSERAEPLDGVHGHTICTGRWPRARRSAPAAPAVSMWLGPARWPGPPAAPGWAATSPRDILNATVGVNVAWQPWLSGAADAVNGWQATFLTVARHPSLPVSHEPFAQALRCFP